MVADAWVGMSYLAIGGMAMGIALIAFVHIMRLRMQIAGTDSDMEDEPGLQAEGTSFYTEPGTGLPSRTGKDFSSLNALEDLSERARERIAPSVEKIQSAASRILSGTFKRGSITEVLTTPVEVVETPMEVPQETHTTPRLSPPEPKVEEETKKNAVATVAETLGIADALKNIEFTEGIEGVYERLFLSKVITGEIDFDFTPEDTKIDLFGRKTEVTSKDPVVEVETEILPASEQVKNAIDVLKDAGIADVPEMPQPIGRLDQTKMKPFKNEVK